VEQGTGRERYAASGPQACSSRIKGDQQGALTFARGLPLAQVRADLPGGSVCRGSIA
jgi:hypothetical protein